jgi:hypothetical protein
MEEEPDDGGVRVFAFALAFAFGFGGFKRIPQDCSEICFARRHPAGGDPDGLTLHKFGSVMGYSLRSTLPSPVGFGERKVKSQNQGQNLY